MYDRHLTRRSVLTGTVGITMTGLAGCLSDGESPERTTVAETATSDSSIAASMRVRRAEDEMINDNLEIFVTPDTHVVMGSLTDDLVHIMSSRSWYTEVETDDGGVLDFSDPEEKHVLSLGLPDRFDDETPIELTMFPNTDPEMVPDGSYFGDLSKGTTFGADPDVTEVFDVRVDTTAGTIELEPRDEIPLLQDDHKAESDG